MDEIWKLIPGCKYYEASNLGRVKSLSRLTKSSLCSRLYIIKGRILKPSDNGAGYLTVSIRKCSKFKKYYIHRLVAESFIPNPGSKATVNHIDGDKYNNNLNNLEWNTQSENNTHAYISGLKDIRGEKNPCSKLDAQIVQEIVARYESGYHSAKELAQAYSVSKSTIHRVLRGEAIGYF